MGKNKLLASLSITLFVLFAQGSAFGLDCPKAPEQINKEWQVEVTAAIAKIGPVKGGELKTKTRSVIRDLMGKLPNADKVYLEQMMYSTYCSGLRDDKTLTETQKRNRIKVYNDEVRESFRDKSSMPKGEISGKLTPGSKPMPRNICPTIPAKAIALFLGNSVAYSSSFPHTVIEVGNEKLLVINRKNNKITISGKFFSRDNRIVGELKDNQFYVNPNNYFRIERPNGHSLIVYDQEGNQAINVDFLNLSAIKLLGRFYLPNRPPIIIDEDRQTIGGLKMSNNCFGESKVDIHLE